MALHLPQESRAQNLKWLIMKIQMGFQRPIFTSRDLLREPFESLVMVSGRRSGQRQALHEGTGGSEARDALTSPLLSRTLSSCPYHKIITATQRFWVANGLTGTTAHRASTRKLVISELYFGSIGMWYLSTTGLTSAFRFWKKKIKKWLPWGRGSIQRWASKWPDWSRRGACPR